MTVKRLPVTMEPARDRVLIRPFFPGSLERRRSIVRRVMALAEEAVRELLAQVQQQFSDRHFDIHDVFRRHFERVRDLGPAGVALSEERQLLIGAYFTSEYALESAALFNPSIVPHPDQHGVPAGGMRFVMSLRATGEGHISSIEFRSGLILKGGAIRLDAVGTFVTEPHSRPDPKYHRQLFATKLREIGDRTPVSEEVLGRLPERFSRGELARAVEAYRGRRNGELDQEERQTLRAMQWLADSNYDVEFAEEVALSERVIFPFSSNETNGIEDARFVRFVDDDGEVTYYATYTAYNGQVILPQMLETRDFLGFHIRTLNGPAVQNKGMALFPRRIGGRYAMVGRQDNESLFIMSSDHPHFWFDAKKLIGPIEPWEFIQIGNCGSPIETEKGWLLLTHGVGPMRRYCIGAILLDLEEPSRVIGRLHQPLLQPNENEREGYVPNVVYTCGAMVHRGRLIMPYAMSDYASSIATMKIDELLAAMGPA